MSSTLPRTIEKPGFVHKYVDGQQTHILAVGRLKAISEHLPTQYMLISFSKNVPLAEPWVLTHLEQDMKSAVDECKGYPYLIEVEWIDQITPEMAMEVENAPESSAPSTASGSTAGEKGKGKKGKSGKKGKGKGKGTEKGKNGNGKGKLGKNSSYTWWQSD
eukprot:4380173-Karenia_brevis.AAC.1